ncbi:hypothetical protein DFP72DRAFT_866408 [Ephemerocybe angulata]|uniref:Chromo domain-containing protein n=1 Tax=Ephemerocybe angulata TaxID=980116 RepID=A0A8H6IJ54_9AGAR|nr:hypothetical protein DFP72DRAFT_866408 [Tulosesus angulatus]
MVRKKEDTGARVLRRPGDRLEVIMAARVAEPSDDEGEPSTSKKKKKNTKGKQRKKKKETGSDEGWEYFVKWYEYEEKDNSWEPAENMKECKRLLSSFWQAVGMDDKDYYPGEIITPPDEWIERNRYSIKSCFLSCASTDVNWQASASVAVKKEVEEPPQLKASASSSKTEYRKKRSIIESDQDTDSASEPDSDVPLARKRQKTTAEPSPAAASSSMASKEVKPATNGISKGKRKRSEEIEPPGPPQKQLHVSNAPSPSSLFSEKVTSTDVAANHVESALPTLGPREKPPPPPLPVRTGAHVPSLPVRRAAASNPHTKIASMTEGVASGSGLSTKQRLAQGALAPTLPRKMSAPSLNPHVPRGQSPVKTGSKSIMTTGFRHTTGIRPSATIQHEPTLAQLNAPPDSPPVPSPITDLPIAESPTEMEFSDHPFDHRPSYGMQAADDFLNAMMPPEMAGPLEPAAERPVEPLPPVPLPMKAPSLPNRSVAKGYKWEGSLVLASNSDSSSPEVASYKVAIEDDVDTRTPALRFSIFLNAVSQLETRNVYHARDLARIIPACKAPTQFARMTLRPDEDKKHWGTFTRYLLRYKQVLMIPLHLDGNVVAHLLVAPLGSLPKGITVPGEVATAIRTKESLAVCTLPWTLSQGQIKEEWRGSSAIVERMEPNALVKGYRKSLKSRPVFQEAIRTLRFPPTVLQWLKKTSRAWTICSLPQTRESSTMFEIQSMKAILLKLEADGEIAAKKDKNTLIPREAHTPETAGMVFLHVSALQHLNRFPFLRERIASPEYVRFYTFGTHPSVYKKCWGVKEIFPAGGIVTFMPSVFIKYPLEARKLIRKLDEHPFWSAYILPPVLGMVSKLVGMETTNSAFSYILKAIEDGQLALLEAPPDNMHCFGQPASDRRSKWFLDYLNVAPPTQEDALAMGKAAYNSVIANSPHRPEAIVEREVAEDMSRMQRQPVFMQDHRRFVVLTGEPVFRQDLLEWLMPPLFDFKDAMVNDRD